MADDVKIGEKQTEDGKKLVVQLEIPEGTIEHAIDSGTRSALLAGAVSYIVKEVTPELVQKWVTDLFSEAIKDFNTWTVREHLKKIAEPMLVEVLARPENRQLIRKQVEAAVEGMITSIPEKLREEFAERLTNTLIKGWRG